MKRVLYTDPYTQKEVYMHQNNDGTSYIEQKQSFEGLEIEFDNFVHLNPH